MRDVLRHPTLDAAFKELVLTLPSEAYVAEQLDVGRPAAHPRGARGDEAQLAQRAARRLGMGVRDAPGDAAATRPTRSRRAGARSPTSALLDALPRRGRARRRGLAGPRLPALQGRGQHDRPRRARWSRCSAPRAELAEPALERFHAMFEDEPLVIDKWFSLQATAPERDGKVFERVKALMRAPGLQHRQPEPRAQPDRRVLPRATRRRSTAPTPPATRSGPTACSSSTRSTRSWPRASRARWTAGPSSPSRYRSAARARRSRRVAAQPELVERRARDRHARAARPAEARHGIDEEQEERVLRPVGRRHRRHQRLGLRRDRDRARATATRIGNVYAGRNGIIGALTEDLIDTGKESAAAIARAALDAVGRVRLVPLQAQVARREPARVRAADRGLQGARHRLVLLQRRRRLGRHLLQGQPAVGSRWATRCRRSTCRRRSTTTCRSPTAARASARSPSTSRCRRSRRRSTCARWRAPRPRCSCSR